ncbi:DUF6531 domain-containing protein, partial [Pseudomonas spelaei]
MIAQVGLLSIAGLDPKAPNAETVFSDFRRCLNNYEDWAESFWSFSALDVEQLFKVGDEVVLTAPASSYKPVSAVTTACPATGPLTLVHMFQTARFVPIGNTEVALQAVDANGKPVGQPLYKTIGPSGILEVTECTRDQRYQVTFYPAVSKDQVKALYTSYQSVITPLESWLRSEWSHTFEPLWKGYSEANYLQRYRALQRADAQGFGNALQTFWDEIQSLPQALADLKPNSEKLLEYLTQQELDQLLQASSEALANGLLVLSDEPLLFIYLSVIVSWIRMLPPPFLIEVAGALRAEILISILLLRVAGGMGMKLRMGAKVLGNIKSARVRQWFTQLGEKLAELTAGPSLGAHAERVKPLLLNSPATPIKVVPSVPLKAGVHEVPNPVPLVRVNKQPRTALVKQEHVDDVPVASKNPKGDAAASADKTATHGCPVSMVTGEELLTLTDGELDGFLPFAWTRLYRTSAVEIDCGLGFGWSHGLAHCLSVNGESVVWTDHENRSTVFPLPTVSRPSISNSLAEAAIYLGASPDELVLAQASRFYHFRDGLLTSISDAYDNRLRISRDVLGRIQRL